MKIFSIFLLLHVYLFATVDIGLTKEEKQWLKEHPSITVGIDNNYAPFEFVDKNGEFKGIAIDYLKEIEKILDIKINIVTANTWDAVTNLAKHKSIDVLSCLVETHERAKYLKFTKPYLSFPMAIVTNKTIGYVNGLKELNGKTVAVVDEYMSNQLLEEYYKNIFLVKTKDLTQGLELVISGKTFAYVGNLSQITYSLQENGFDNLAISGIAKYRFNYAMGVRDDQPILRDILQKGIDAVPNGLKESIYCKWFPPLYQQAIDYTLVWRISIFSFFIILIFIYWMYRLKSEIKKRKLTEEQLTRNKEWLSCSLKSANIGAWDWDITQRVITGNSVFAKLLDLDEEEVSINMEQFKKEFIHKDDLQSILKHQEDCFSSTDEFCKTTFRLITKQGRVKTVESSSRIFKYDAYNNPTRMIGFIKEIERR
jgi:ABC-type amino acid transport substrate-binding protein